jgi:hypothetical protein
MFIFPDGQILNTALAFQQGKHEVQVSLCVATSMISGIWRSPHLPGHCVHAVQLNVKVSPAQTLDGRNTIDGVAKTTGVEK